MKTSTRPPGTSPAPLLRAPEGVGPASRRAVVEEPASRRGAPSGRCGGSAARRAGPGSGGGASGSGVAPGGGALEGRAVPRAL